MAGLAQKGGVEFFQKWLPAEDWGPRMAQDLASVRKSLRVTTPGQYARIIGHVNRERAGVRPADAVT